MKKIAIVALVFLIGTLGVFAQNADISGTIKGMLYNERLGKSIPFQKTFHFLN